MMRVVASVCLLLAALSASGQSSAAPAGSISGSGSGSICGRVLNENGIPAALVKVIAFDMGAHSGPMQGGTTDQLGNYCVNNLAIGDYVMTADDTEQGYPVMTSLFYSAEPVVLTKITAENLAAHFNWQIPFKAGFVKVHLTDAQTQAPIAAMSYSLVLRSRPDTGYLRGSSDSTRTLLVPPDKEIEFTVSSPGYKDWPGDGMKILVSLHPGIVQEFEIALEPAGP